MVRTTTDADDESTNDLTRFLSIVADARRDFEADFDDVRAIMTAKKDSYDPNDDFDDDGNYVGDDPVHVQVEVTRTVVADRVDATALAMVDGVTERDGFGVVDVDRSGHFTAPVDTSGTFDQPVGGGRDATHYTITVTARRRIE